MATSQSGKSTHSRKASDTPPKRQKSGSKSHETSRKKETQQKPEQQQVVDETGPNSSAYDEVRPRTDPT